MKNILDAKNFGSLVRYIYIFFLCSLILIKNSLCTQTDYFGVFDVDYSKVFIYIQIKMQYFSY